MSYTCLHYHIIFSVKGRRALMNQSEMDRLCEYCGGILRNHGGTLHQAGGPADPPSGDHSGPENLDCRYRPNTQIEHFSMDSRELCGYRNLRMAGWIRSFLDFTFGVAFGYKLYSTSTGTSSQVDLSPGGGAILRQAWDRLWSAIL